MSWKRSGSALSLEITQRRDLQGPRKHNHEDTKTRRHEENFRSQNLSSQSVRQYSHVEVHQ
jgi:hypothetical protein